MAVEAQFADGSYALQQPNTVAYVQGKEMGPGLLNIDENYLSWTSDDQTDKFSFEYPNISIHAICRDTSVFPYECVYLLHCPQSDSDMEEEEEEGDTSNMTEIRLVPPDPSQLEGIFHAISECQTLYPDVEQMNSSDEEVDDTPAEDGDEPDEGDFFTTPEGLQHLTPEGQRVLEHLESVFQMPTPEEFDQMVSNGTAAEDDSHHNEGQFEDAD